MSSSEILKLRLALSEAQLTLELIAAPARADGSYNRCRKACEMLAKKSLDDIKSMLAPE